MGRLYDETLQMRESIDRNFQSIVELRQSIVELRESATEQRATADDLLEVARIHQQSLVSHERRLDRTEVTVEAILEDLRRHREDRPQA